MSTNQLNLLLASFMTPGLNGRWGLPLMLKGDPATAKTSLIAAVGKALDLPVHTSLTAIHDPTDYAGLMYFEDDENGIKRTRYASPPLASNLAGIERAVMFFDEANCGAPATQAAMLRIIFEGVVGEEKVSDGVRFVAAMNDPDQAPNADELAMSLANRFGHIEWAGPTFDDWAAYMAGEPTENACVTCDIKSEDDVLAEWNDAYKTAAAESVSFLRKFPALRQAPPKAHEDAAHAAWPSNRTWEMTTRALASARIHNFGEDDIYAFMSAFVGTGAATQFTAWLREQDVPDAEDVLDDVDNFQLDPTRLDRNMAILWACATLVAPENENDNGREDLAVPMWRLLERVCSTNPDLAMKAARHLANRNIGKRTKPARKVLSTLAKAMKAAGF